jgi:hypothetical protein
MIHSVIYAFDREVEAVAEAGVVDSDYNNLSEEVVVVADSGSTLAAAAAAALVAVAVAADIR